MTKSKFSATEKRIRKIEDDVRRGVIESHEGLVYAMCEVARQLRRLAYLYQFELGLEEKREEEEVQP
jgi:hypothetical protein